MGVNSLPKTATRQRRGCDLNPGPSAPESSTPTILLPSHPRYYMESLNWVAYLYIPEREGEQVRCLDAIGVAVWSRQ